MQVYGQFLQNIILQTLKETGSSHAKFLHQGSSVGQKFSLLENYFITFSKLYQQSQNTRHFYQIILHHCNHSMKSLISKTVELFFRLSRCLNLKI